jgi:hypothetical protein
MYGSSGRAPASQTQSPQSKPQYHKKKKKKLAKLYEAFVLRYFL